MASSQADKERRPLIYLLSQYMNIIGISGNVFRINVLKNHFIENGEISARKNSNAKDRKFQASKDCLKSTFKSCRVWKTLMIRHMFQWALTFWEILKILIEEIGELEMRF